MMEYGDLVVVQNTLHYNDRVGRLRPTSDDPDDFWDWYVELLDGTIIGVDSEQVRPAADPRTQAVMRGYKGGLSVSTGDTGRESWSTISADLTIALSPGLPSTS